ncbi:MAG: M28 family peptidase, partial [Thermomicrobiaceae bacterium]|nr:M28 family peptidase [Thermomicrobiaceae bacterium]
VLIASIPPTRPFDETFVLLSGHVDSWHYGAMDNGSANASMIECARLLAERRDDLRREVRLAFWSGHSHARYATSAWFADEFWTELHERCVAHVNIDSPGGVGATVLTEAPTMAETYDLARALIAQLADQDLEYRRIGRMGDQSFWGVGVPSLYCSISEQALAPDATDISAALTGSKARSGGLGWWWHTPDDTIDKIDPANLRRDARVLLATVYRLATDRVLPFAPSRAVDEIRQALGEIASAAADAFDLAPALADVDALLDAARRLEERLGRPLDDEQARAANRAVMEVSHWLIPVNYTRTGQFDQDLALGERSLPGLRPAERLRGLPSADRHLLETRLRRERNRLRFALRQARAGVERALATLG